jgi:hypothetical protein
MKAKARRPATPVAMATQPTVNKEKLLVDTISPDALRCPIGPLPQKGLNRISQTMSASPPKPTTVIARGWIAAEHAITSSALAGGTAG